MQAGLHEKFFVAGLQTVSLDVLAVSVRSCRSQCNRLSFLLPLVRFLAFASKCTHSWMPRRSFQLAHCQAELLSDSWMGLARSQWQACCTNGRCTVRLGQGELLFLARVLLFYRLPNSIGYKRYMWTERVPVCNHIAVEGISHCAQIQSPSRSYYVGNIRCPLTVRISNSWCFLAGCSPFQAVSPSAPQSHCPVLTCRIF